MSPFGVEEAECQSCRAVRRREDLDRYLWCTACVEAMGRRAARWGWLSGLVASASLALWIGLAARPGPEYRWIWFAPVLLTYLLLSRIGRTIAVGLYRSRGMPGISSAKP